MFDAILHLIGSIDTAVALALNSLVHRNEAFDRLVLFCADNPFVKGAPFVALFCWLWFEPRSDQDCRRGSLILLLFASLAALFLSLLLLQLLPFRPRPIHEATLHLNLPYGMDSAALAHWNSIPSDHGVLYGSLAMGFFLISRMAGRIAFAWTIVFILLPRIYLGFHYLSDILAGVFIGAATMAVMFYARAVFVPAEKMVVSLERRMPAFFYAASFLLLWQLSSALIDVRNATGLTKQLALSILFGGRPAQEAEKDGLRCTGLWHSSDVKICEEQAEPRQTEAAGR
jgi:undecaprenyl-diphosphatase